MDRIQKLILYECNITVRITLSIRLWVGKHFAMKKLPIMLGRWILDGTKKIPCHTARSFHGGGFPSPTPMGGRTGSAGRRLPMARLETNR